jgi:hypothetical protein
MKTYTIPYQYTIVGHAYVEAKNLEQAVDLVHFKVQCPVPKDIENLNEIKKVSFFYLNESFEVYEDDLDIVNNLDEEVERLNNCNLIQD